MWSYDTALATQKDQVRLRIGDTDPEDEQLQDEEIGFLILVGGESVDAVALLACDVLIAKYSRYVSESMDGISLSNDQRIGQYQTLKDEILNSSSGILNIGGPIAGGLSSAATGRPVEPFFTRETPESSWPR